MDRVQVLADRPYGPGDALHRFDAYLPPNVSGNAPVVLLIHGGVIGTSEPRPKAWGMFRSWGRLLAASGFVAIAFNHRLGFPDPHMEDAQADVSSMIETVRRDARPLHANSDRLALVAFSAGAPLLTPYLREPATGVRAVAGFYPLLDLRPSTLHRRAMTPEVLLRFSPAANLSTDTARHLPFFLARAGRDQFPDILPGIDAFIAASLTAGTPLTLFNHPEAPHGFDRDPDPRTREVLTAFLAFLKTHLGPA
jgi:acetyl esterase/lipase